MDALSAIELRVLGVLLEKAATTPDQYPLTLNAIITGCNQKSSRDPVTSFSQGEVQRALRLLEDKLLVSNDPNLRGRVAKYLQRFCKPPFGIYDFDDAQYAVLTVLMLRGPATPGELRTRTDRMHRFASNDAVLDTLQQLADWESTPLVTQLPREPNRRDACWAQLFGLDSPAGQPAQDQPSAPAEALPAQPPTPANAPAEDSLAAVDEKTVPEPVQEPVQEAARAHGAAKSAPAAKTGNGLERLSALETRVAELESALARLQDALGE